MIAPEKPTTPRTRAPVELVPRQSVAPDPRVVSGERPLIVSGEREVGAIVTDVWKNAEKLLRHELELAIAELDRRAQKLKLGMMTATVGAAVLYAGVLALVAAAILGLSRVVAPWLAALIVGVLMTGLGVLLGKRGADKSAESTERDEHLHRTMEAMKEAVR